MRILNEGALASRAAQVLLLVAVIAGCAAPAGHPALDQAEATVERARGTPRVRALAAAELDRAELALERARAGARAGAPPDQVEHMAYIVSQQAALAEARAAERVTRSELGELQRALDHSSPPARLAHRGQARAPTHGDRGERALGQSRLEQARQARTSPAQRERQASTGRAGLDAVSGPLQQDRERPAPMAQDQRQPASVRENRQARLQPEQSQRASRGQEQREPASAQENQEARPQPERIRRASGGQERREPASVQQAQQSPVPVEIHRDGRAPGPEEQQGPPPLAQGPRPERASGPQEQGEPASVRENQQARLQPEQSQRERASGGQEQREPPSLEYDQRVGAPLVQDQERASAQREQREPQSLDHDQRARAPLNQDQKSASGRHERQGPAPVRENQQASLPLARAQDGRAPGPEAQQVTVPLEPVRSERASAQREQRQPQSLDDDRRAGASLNQDQESASGRHEAQDTASTGAVRQSAAPGQEHRRIGGAEPDDGAALPGPAPQEIALILSDLPFEGAEPTEATIARLTALAARLVREPAPILLIQADFNLPDPEARTVMERRVEVVRAILVRRGVAPARLLVRAAGAAPPTTAPSAHAAPG